MGGKSRERLIEHEKQYRKLCESVQYEEEEDEREKKRKK